MDNQFRKDESAPFNMAIATLLSIRAKLDDYAEVASGRKNLIAVAYTKYKMARQIFLLSVPLINNDKAKEDINKDLDALGKCFVNLKTGIGGSKAACHIDTEQKVDKVVEKIQETMQKEKYFMPSKTDPRYGWKEG